MVVGNVKQIPNTRYCHLKCTSTGGGIGAGASTAAGTDEGTSVKECKLGLDHPINYYESTRHNSTWILS